MTDLHMIMKAGASGLIAGIGADLLFGTANVNIMGYNPSTTLLVGASVASGSIVSDIVSEKVIESMNLPQNIKSLEEFAIRGAVCGVASSAAMMATGMP